MRLNMVSLRPWLFRILVACAAGLIVTSAIMPWWTASIVSEQVGDMGTVYLYQYGIPRVLHTELIGEVTPFYQTVLSLIYIAVIVGLILFSIWLRGRKGRWLLGGVGLTYIAYAAIAVVWIAIRTGDLGTSLGDVGTELSLQGQSIIEFLVGDVVIFFTIDASLRFGFYLACAAGFTCVVLALLRDKIVGKPKLGA
jgi:hypothetical protein